MQREVLTSFDNRVRLTEEKDIICNLDENGMPHKPIKRSLKILKKVPIISSCRENTYIRVTHLAKRATYDYSPSDSSSHSTPYLETKDQQSMNFTHR